MTGLFDDLLSELRTRLDRAITELVPAGRPVALIDYPNHENVGDAAIWAGERALLHKHGREVAYVADIAGYSSRAMRRQIGTHGVILLHGGGNFGDLYPHHQALRESVLQEFPRNPIVAMPQTATFRSNDSMVRARSLINRHADVHLLLRDKSSLGYAQEHFEADCRLVPDSAFALRPGAALPRSAVPIVWLARTDGEAAVDRQEVALVHDSKRVLVADWVGKRSASTLVVTRRLATLAAGGVERLIGTGGSPLTPWISRSYESLAANRVSFGMGLLGGAEVIVTDRLHAHIFALLVGIPHVLLNDRYDKVGRFHRTWSRGHAHIRFAASPEAALVEAENLIAGSDDGSRSARIVARTPDAQVGRSFSG